MIIRELRGFLRTLAKSRHMILAMSIRQLEQQYAGSYFGLTWAILNPLFQMAIYGTVFGLLLNLKPDPIYGDAYFLYLLCGLMPWLFVSSIVNSSPTLIRINQNLVKKAVGFPSEILSIVQVVSAAISHLVGMLLLILIILVVTGKLTVFVPLFFIYLLLSVLFCVGISWALAALSVYLPDLKEIVQVVVRAWFYFSPIVYSISRVPEKYRIFLKINPMFDITEGYRYALLAGRLPPLGDFLFLLSVALLVFGIGGYLFKRLKLGFVDVL